jgi:division protein CdvB (Snf7/Vps24/ESCRT-III family)
MDEFKKTYDVESIDKDLKSQIRENVDKVFAEMNEQEGQFLYFCNI